MKTSVANEINQNNQEQEIVEAYASLFTNRFEMITSMIKLFKRIEADINN